MILLGLRFALDRAQVGLWRREFQVLFLPFQDLMHDMNIRFVVLGRRFRFCLFPVFALHRRQTRTSWFHTRRARLSGIRRHRIVHGIGQFNDCEGMPLF